MALVYKNRVSQTCSAPSGSAAFVLSGAATTGYQTWSALADADTAIYSASDASGGWEVGVGTWATSGTTLTRTAILASSNSGSAVSFSGTVTVDLSNDAGALNIARLGGQALIPGGRLTLTSGTAVTASDVTAATTIYYTPYVHNKISLWTGQYWNIVEFTEKSLALGTLTSGRPYDVFCYLSAGVPALESLSWTNGTTRATALVLYDGVLCKSGDKTRVFLGTFYTTSTTTTEDSGAKRYLSNYYNRRLRKFEYASGVSSNVWSPGGDTTRNYANSTTHRVHFVCCSDDIEAEPSPMAYALSAGTTITQIGLGLDSSALISGGVPAANGSASRIYLVGQYPLILSAGLHYLQLLERLLAAVTCDNTFASVRGSITQ